MEAYLKRIKAVLKVNKLLSDFSFKSLKIVNARKTDLKTTTSLLDQENFKIDFSHYHTQLEAYWFNFGTFKSDPLFYETLINGTILSKGIVLDSDNNVHIEANIFQKEYLNALASNHLVLTKALLPKSNVELVVPLLNYLDNNYFHWTLETLTRVLLFKNHPDFNVVHWLVKSKPLPFVKESLAFLFDIPEPRIVQKKLSVRTLFKKCYVISFAHFRNQESQHTNVYYPNIIRQFNKLALKQLAKKTQTNTVWPDKFLISRSKAQVRRFTNEASVLSHLEASGFKAIILEELCFADQVALFSQAKIVVALHGAGLTNIIYGKGLKVIELFPKNRKIRDAFYFAQISGALQLEHHLIGYDPVNSRQDCELSSVQLDQLVALL